LLADFELKSDWFNRWNEWQAKPQSEKDLIWSEWQQYYLECKQGKPFRMLQLMQRAVKVHNRPLIKRIAWAAKYMQQNPDKYFRQKPKFVDPTELVRVISPYLTMKSETDRLDELVRQYAEIYEKPKRKSNTFEPVF